MPAIQKLPQAKLRDFVGQKITITKIVTGTSEFGAYALLVTDKESIITSHKVVLSQVEELRGNLPVTMTVEKRSGKNGFDYFVLA